MFKCLRPLNPLLMLRAKGLSGPFFQQVSSAACMRSVGNWIGSKLPVFFAYFPSATLTPLVMPESAYTFARASAATVVDFEGRVLDVLEDEVRFQGARREWNTCDGQDFVGWNGWYGSSLTRTVGQSDPEGGNTAYRLQIAVGTAGQHSGIYHRPGILTDYDDQDAGSELTVSVWLRADAPVSVNIGSGAVPTGVNVKTVQVTTEWQRFAHTATAFLNTPHRSIGIFSVAADTAVDVYAWHPLSVNVTDRANQNPPADITNIPGDIHNANVPGVAYFDYENGNTVDANGVVTEGQGAAISGIRLLKEAAASNYCDTDDDLTGGAETVDLTAGGTGDYTLSVSGDAAVTVAAGTATGTGFGQATAGSPVTFTLTGAGTVTLTLDSGSLAQSVAGDYIKQIEDGDEATSFIPSPGAGATTRAADALSYADIPADNETRVVVDGADSDTDDWDGVVDEVGLIESIKVYRPGDRPA